MISARYVTVLRRALVSKIGPAGPQAGTLDNSKRRGALASAIQVLLDSEDN